MYDAILTLTGLLNSAGGDVHPRAACSIWSQEVVVIRGREGGAAGPLWRQRVETLEFSEQ